MKFDNEKDKSEFENEEMLMNDSKNENDIKKLIEFGMIEMEEKLTAKIESSDRIKQQN